MAITKITIKTGKRESEWTMDEARDLWAELDRVFGPKNVYYKPYYPPYSPYVPWWSTTTYGDAYKAISGGTTVTYYNEGASNGS